MSSEDEKVAMLVGMVGCDIEVARHILESAGGNVDAAAELLLEGSAVPSPSASAQAAPPTSFPEDEEEEVRAPIEGTTETLQEFHHPMFHGHSYMSMGVHSPSLGAQGVVGVSSYASVAAHAPEAPQDLDIPPLPQDMIFKGTLLQARSLAQAVPKFLVVSLLGNNLDSTHLNNDLWLKESVKELVMRNFVLLQALDSSHTGKELMALYTVEEKHLPATLIINHITGAVIHRWEGLIDYVQFRAYAEPLIEKSNLKGMKIVKPDEKDIAAKLEALRPSTQTFYESDVEEEESDVEEMDEDSEVEVVEETMDPSVEQAKEKRRREEEDYLMALKFQEEIDRSERRAAQREAQGSETIAQPHVFEARNLREEQDVAFLEAEQEMRAAEAEEKRKKQESEEMKIIEKQDQEYFEDLVAVKKAALISEPSDGAGVSTIRFRLPDGRTFNRRFDTASLISDVADYLITEGVDMRKHMIVGAFPVKNFTDMSLSLRDADLKGRVAVNVVRV